MNISGFDSDPGASPPFAPFLVHAPHERSFVRFLVAIVAVDVVGYSALMEADDVGTARRLRLLRGTLLEPTTRLFGGSLFSIAGDGAMACFSSAKTAVACAVTIQRRLDGPRASWGLRLRIGISYGSVLQIGQELYGAPLNVAARLEAQAGPGEILASGATVERAQGLPGVCFHYLGEWRLAKMDVPCSAYRVL